MSRRAQLIFFCLGTGVFGYLVARIGPAQLWSDAHTTGWMFVPIVLLYGVVHALNTQALQLILSDEPRRPGFGRTFSIVVAGSALNFVTPIVNAGGEPYRITALAPYVGAGRSTGAVIIHTMLRALSSLLIWMAALVMGLILLPMSRAMLILFPLAFLILAGLIGLLLSGHRQGLLERLLDLLHRLPGLRRFAANLESRRPWLTATDRQIREFYHGNPDRFAKSLALECASRCVFMLEFCLIGASVGIHVGYLAAFVIGGIEALVTNVLFFVPFDLGTHESVTYLLFHQLGYTSGLGLYAALVGRVRDMIWIAAGLALIWAGGRRAAAGPTRAGVSG